MATSFVYKWTNLVTGMMYIGVHKGPLDDGYVCSSKVMLKEYQERPGDFSRVVLAEFEDYKDARAHEINVLTEIDAAKNPMYYNKSNGTNMVKFWRIGPMSEEHKKKIGDAHRGKYFRPDVQEKMLKAIRGKPLSEEHKKKISEGGKGLVRSKETKDKIRKANLGKTLSEEHKRKISLTRKQRLIEKKNGNISI